MQAGLRVGLWSSILILAIVGKISCRHLSGDSYHLVVRFIAGSVEDDHVVFPLIQVLSISPSRIA
jgi:uncharacterized membrane protein